MTTATKQSKTKTTATRVAVVKPKPRGKMNRARAEAKAKAQRNKITVNEFNIVALHATIKAPRSFKYKHHEATKEIRASRKTEMLEADIKLLRYRDEGGRYRVHPEIQEFTRISNDWSSFLNKVSLDIQLRGMRVVSIHRIDEIKNKISSIRDEIKLAAEECVRKLPEWVEIAKMDNTYFPDIFPDREYFRRYTLDVRFLPFVSEKVTLQSDDTLTKEVVLETLDKLAESIAKTLSSIASYISGESRKFHDSAIENLQSDIEELRKSKFVEGEAFDELLNSASLAAESLNSAAIREAVQRINGGTTSFVQPRGRRGRPVEPIRVTEQDIQECKQYLSTSLTPLKDSLSDIDELMKGVF